MSDSPSGPGWWQASDDRWYPPETHPDYRPPEPQRPTPGLATFAPPKSDQRYPTPTAPPPAVQGRSTTRVLVLIFGAVFLLLAGGCGLFVYNFRDEIADATIDFTDADPIALDGDVPVACEVVGAGFGENYGVDVTLTSPADAVASHYQVEFQLLADDGELLGTDSTVLRDMAPAEERTEDAFNTIVISADAETVSCEVSEVRRVTA